MGISLCKAGVDDAEFIHQMQVKAFRPLLEKYKDYETSPANESVEQMRNRINQSFADYYTKEWGSPSRFLQSLNRNIMMQKNGSWIVLNKSRETAIYMKR